MTSQNILPVTLSKFAEIEFLHLSNAIVTLVTQNFRFLEILLREVNTLELIKQANVTQ